MKLYNTLSRQKEEFSTADGRVKMYVCGVTPYAPSHVGHAMSSIVFDVIRRYLEFCGREVEQVKNFTDIDDKMILAATKSGISTKELADANIERYQAEMDALNVLRAQVYPRATEEISKILKMVQVLVDRGHAYATNGDVYFRVRQDEDYGKLSRRSLDSMIAGARVEVDEHKEDLMDFTLWKRQKPGEPSWDSPWGPGRPGWHIECSAMSMRYLGETLDIHGGGQDLVFPHHENEIAQSEAYSRKTPFVRFWVHNGMLRRDDDEMHKSLGNFVTVADALETFSPDALRLFFLSSHYRSPLTYTEEAVSAQERALERLRNAVRVAGIQDKGSPIEARAYLQQFTAAMDDDLNTPRATAALFDLAREINRGREQGRDVTDGRATLTKLAGVLGLTLDEREDQATPDLAPFVDLLLETRERLRAASQYELADHIRDQLAKLGVVLEDTSTGTVWKQQRR